MTTMLFEFCQKTYLQKLTINSNYWSANGNMEILYYLQLFDKHKKQSTLFKNAVT